MNNIVFYTLTIKSKDLEDKCLDLPKDMPIPRKGEIIFIDGWAVKVYKVNYHVHESKSYTISLSGVAR